METNGDDPADDAVTIVGCDELGTGKIDSNGRLYVGSAHEGKSVKYALRFEEQQPETERA